MKEKTLNELELNSIKQALEDCIESIELLHPVMDAEEPCTVYTSWINAKLALKNLS